MLISGIYLLHTSKFVDILKPSSYFM